MATVSAISDTTPGGAQSDTMCGLCYTPALYKIIPLLTFGSLELDSLGNQASPSFIGVDCSLGRSVLAANLQTPVSVTGGDLGGGPFRPGCFYMSGSSYPYTDDTDINADTIHHALISFDLGAGGASAVYTATDSTLSSDARFNWAVDDVSKVGGSMNPSGGGRWSSNGISDLKTIVPHGIVDNVSYPSAPTPSYSGLKIGSTGKAVGVPSSTEFASSVVKVEMSNLQIFTGTGLLDVTDETNRRAFVSSDVRPVSPLLSQALLGKTPEVLIQTQSDWIAGNNRGTAGTFTVVGTLNSFTP